LIEASKIAILDVMKTIKVVELFAGVGGFRIGLENASGNPSGYKFVWSNQWEPATKSQSASDIYVARFGPKGHSNEDIEKVIEGDFESIPNHDLLVGGFPCQDYSVARTLPQSHGLIGQKGVLWWSIYTILKRKGDKAPRYLMLENVDRLLKSPAIQRGRDFAVMLASLSDLGYAVEWRIVNAADYGFPQRRRRVFILGYKEGTPMYRKISKARNRADIIYKEGVADDAFPVLEDGAGIKEFEIEGDLGEISEEFSHGTPKLSPFMNAGVMIDRQVSTVKVQSDYDGKRTVLGDILQDEKDVPEEFFVNGDLSKWAYHKGAKREERTSKSGHKYHYAEGPMVFPDALDKPSRTIVTGEGGSAPSRFKHVVKTKSGRYRRLTPLELERLDMFPDNHTQLEGVGDKTRAFIAGNALVVGVIEKLGSSLLKKV
jgi:DNA (cytosine-5)-methyltransferase 1